MKNRISIILLTFLMAGTLLWLVLPQTGHAAADVEVSFVFGPQVISPTNSLQVGDVFTTRVRAHSLSNQVVDTYGFYMTFSPTVVSVTNVTALYPITGFNVCPVPIGFDNSAGRIVGECSDIGGGANSDGLELIEITFEVVQTNSRFDLLFDQICDGPSSSECFQLLNSGTNQIGSYHDAFSTPTAVFLVQQQTSYGLSRGALTSIIVVVALGCGTGLLLFRRKSQLSGK